MSRTGVSLAKVPSTMCQPSGILSVLYPRQASSDLPSNSTRQSEGAAESDGTATAIAARANARTHDLPGIVILSSSDRALLAAQGPADAACEMLLEPGVLPDGWLVAERSIEHSSLPVGSRPCQREIVIQSVHPG